MAKKVNLTADELVTADGSEKLVVSEVISDYANHNHLEAYAPIPAIVTNQDEFLKWTGSEFVKQQLVAGINVQLTDPADGDMIFFDGTNWTNKTPFKASGGEFNTFTDDNGVSWGCHVFEETSLFSIEGSKEIEYLIIAGGGGGGYWNNAGGYGANGGGGAGALIQGSFQHNSGPMIYTITVGAGGSSNGGDTTIYLQANLIATALGGGAGSSRMNTSIAPTSGGSGGGGAYLGGGAAGGLGGNAGGGSGPNRRNTAGGGGGAGEAGHDGIPDAYSDPAYHGNGGDGLEINFNGTAYWFAGGGGAGGYGFGNGHGGKGGGASRGGQTTQQQGYKNLSGLSSASGGTAYGAQNSGGGGGGRSGDASQGNGGSGIVMLRYRV